MTTYGSDVASEWAGKRMRRKAAQKWVIELNKRGYTGYHDWRFPTVEEAASLLESSKKNGDMYIAPLFSNKQSGIWTGDKKSDSYDAWYVCFSIGRVYERNLCINDCVRPVRSGK